MLAGSTAGTLIGLIFIVITLGMEHSKADDEVRTRLFVTPILVHFACLLIISLVMVVPTSAVTRALALALGAIGCAGLAYVTNLELMSQRRTGTEDRELLWDVLLPIASYVLVAIAAAAWALQAPFANMTGAVAVLLLLVTALRNSLAVTLAIAGRGRN